MSSSLVSVYDCWSVVVVLMCLPLLFVCTIVCWSVAIVLMCLPLLFVCMVVCWSVAIGPSRWPSGKASASRAEDPGFKSRLRRDFFGVESYQ